MIIKKFLKIITPVIGASVGLVACFGNGTPDASDTVAYGTLYANSESTVYSSAALQTAFINSQVNAGFESIALGYDNNLANLQADFGLSAKNALGTGRLASNTVTAYTIKYNVPGVNANTQQEDINRTVSGLVLLPESGTPIKGIVLYYHPTETVKNQVPSCLPESNFVAVAASGQNPLPNPNNFAYCNQQVPESSPLNYDSMYITVLGNAFAAQGYVVVATDYIGLGNDVSVVHPYVVYPQVNAQTGIYMLKAAKTLLQQINYTGVKFDGNTNVFVTGFSEGGSYALSASQQLQTNMASWLEQNGMQLRVTAPAEGAYDLRTSQMNYEFGNLQDGLTNGSYTGEPPLADCVAISKTSVNNNCYPSQFSAEVNKWNVGSSLAAALAKPYLVDYALTAYGYYSLGNQSAGYNMIMMPLFWQNIPYLIPDGKGGVEPSGIVYNTLQLYTIPNLIATNGVSVIFHANTLYNPQNNQLYNTSESSYNTFYLSGNGRYILNLAKITIPESFPVVIPPIATGNGVNNSAAAFVPENIRTLGIFTDTMEKASTYKWATSSPIDFISLDYDSVVPVANSSTAYPYMFDQSPNNVYYTALHNFQLSNDLDQFMVPRTTFPAYNLGAITRYWTPLQPFLAEAIASFACPSLDPACISKTLGTVNLTMAMPIDHTNAGPFLAIAALNVFDNFAIVGNNPKDLNGPNSSLHHDKPPVIKHHD